MRFVLETLLVALLIGAGGFTSDAKAQTLYGNEGASQTLWEFPSAPGAPCAQPLSILTPCGYRLPICPVLPPPMLVPPPPTGIQGDVAMNCLTSPATGTDTVFITDGLVIEEYVADGPCGAPPP